MRHAVLYNETSVKSYRSTEYRIALLALLNRVILREKIILLWMSGIKLTWVRINKVNDEKRLEFQTAVSS